MPFNLWTELLILKFALDNGKKNELSKQVIIIAIKCCFYWYMCLSMHERHNAHVIWVVVNPYTAGQW